MAQVCAGFFLSSLFLIFRVSGRAKVLWEPVVRAMSTLTDLLSERLQFCLHVQHEVAAVQQLTADIIDACTPTPHERKKAKRTETKRTYKRAAAVRKSELLQVLRRGSAVSAIYDTATTGTQMEKHSKQRDTKHKGQLRRRELSLGASSTSLSLVDNSSVTTEDVDTSAATDKESVTSFCRSPSSGEKPKRQPELPTNQHAVRRRAPTREAMGVTGEFSGNHSTRSESIPVSCWSWISRQILELFQWEIVAVEDLCADIWRGCAPTVHKEQRIERDGLKTKKAKTRGRRSSAEVPRRHSMRRGPTSRCNAVKACTATNEANANE
uniref:Uncharacterized protein n=1 Tax=Noctiluca scintillans TaxID=2966 RepID=A0A7S1AVM5_NOCSC